ncbi:MAG: hypothetical protein ACKOU7_02275 [Ferruginibacter sp.]
MHRSCLYPVTFLLLLSCNNHFHQSRAVVKQQTAVIRNYIQAEDTRDSLQLKALLADTIACYWKMEDPGKRKIIDFYKDYWTKNRYSKNTIQSVTAIAKNTYRVQTFFEVQRMQADTAIHVQSTIVYTLNAGNKIVCIGKE